MMPSTGPGSKPLSRSASCAARTFVWLRPLRADLRLLPEELMPVSLDPLPLIPLPLIPDPLLLIPLLLPLLPVPDELRDPDCELLLLPVSAGPF
jgi:hypothetical protein